MKKTPLSVSPVRRYRRPKYPSWQDKNPLEHPETVPYPLRKKVMHVLAASGIASSLVFAGTQCTEANPATKYGIHPDSLYNPFPFQVLGLPYHSPAFGTGQPERMKEKEIRSIIEKIAAEHGLHLQPDYLFQSGENVILLNGFDPEHKIGYVFISHERLDEDGFAGFYLRGRANSIEYMETALAFMNSPNDWTNAFSTDIKRKLNQIAKEQDSPTRLELVHQVVMEDFIKQYLEKDVPKWLKKRIRAALRLTEPSERKLAVDQCVLAIDLVSSGILAELKFFSNAYRILEESLFRPGKPPLTRSYVQKMSALFWYLYYVESRYKRPPTDPDSEIQKAAAAAKQAEILQALAATGDEFDQNLESLILESDAYFLSLSDIRMLDSLAQRGEMFVAPLSQYSNGLAYRFEDSTNLAAVERLLKQSKDSVEIESLERSIQNNKFFRKRELEKNMHRYVLWARSQGKY
jgi:hypothetical protein